MSSNTKNEVYGENENDTLSSRRMRGPHRCNSDTIKPIFGFDTPEHRETVEAVSRLKNSGIIDQDTSSSIILALFGVDDRLLREVIISKEAESQRLHHHEYVPRVVFICALIVLFFSLIFSLIIANLLVEYERILKQ